MVYSFVKRKFPGCHIEGEKLTYFSDLLFVRTRQGQHIVVQHLMPRMDLKPWQLNQLMEWTELFMQHLCKLNVPMPDMHLFVESESLFMISTHAGKDLETTLFENGLEPSLTQELLRKVLLGIQGFLGQNQAHPLIGMDLLLSNFGVQNGVVTYLDPFPPLLWYEPDKLFIVHYPQPLDSERINTELERKWRRFGTLRRFFGDVMRVCPHMEEFFFTALQNALPQHAADLQAQLLELPENRIQSMQVQEATDFIGSLGISSQDQFRMVGARLLGMEPERQERMQHVFALSRIDTSAGYMQPHKVRIQMLKEYLLSLLVQQQ
jgi:hypothetical protein